MKHSMDFWEMLTAGTPRPGLSEPGRTARKKKEIKGHGSARTGLEALFPERASYHALLSQPQLFSLGKAHRYQRFWLLPQ
jgi:hypothetical protein